MRKDDSRRQPFLRLVRSIGNREEAGYIGFHNVSRTRIHIVAYGAKTLSQLSPSTWVSKTGLSGRGA
jgi:hypothetical protein